MNGIIPIPVMMKLMKMNLIYVLPIAYGTIGDQLWNRALILPLGID